MKLLFCGHCNDIVRLFSEPRSCQCGRSWGQYLPDNSTTVQTNYSLSLGLANPDFHAAIQQLMQNRQYFSPALAVRVWFNPDSEPDVTYITEMPMPAAPAKTSVPKPRKPAPKATKKT